MKIDKSLQDDYAILTLKGEFDTFYCPALMQEVETLVERGINHLVLDMRLVKFINSTALGAVIKAHKHTSRPSTFSSDSESQTVSWARNEGKWVDITAVFDSTSWRGIALDPNSTSSTTYGRARGFGQTNAPKLRVTYTR